MRKKLASICAATLFAAVALAGCSSDGSGGTDQSGGGAAGGEEVTPDVNEDGTVNNPEKVEVDPNKLVFWSLFSGGDGGFMDEILEEYSATNPTKDVQSVMLVWADYYTKLTTAVATGNGPDIGVSHISKLPELVAKGVVDPIDEYAEAAGVNWDDYPASSVEGVTFDGQQYAIPLDTHAEIMYVNKDFFDKAGLELNADGQVEIDSLDQFKDVLTKLKDSVGDGNTALSLTQQGDDPYRVWWATYFQMGRPAIISEDGTTVSMDKATAVKAADFVKSLYDDGFIQPGIADHQKMFQEGHAAMLFGGTWATGAFEQTDGLNFTPQLYPALFNDSEAAWADSHVLIIPKNPDRTPEETLAAVEFIHFVASTGGLTWAASGQIPANSTVTSDPAYAELPFRSSYMKAKDVAVLPSKSENFYALKDTMIKNLDTIWNDQTDSTTAIDNMFGEMESDLG